MESGAGCVVDHHADVIDVDAAGSDVGGDEHRQRSVGELVQHPLTHHLRKIAVDRLGGHTKLGERVGDPVARPLRLAEHEHLGDRLTDRPDDAVLVHVVHGEEQVVHRADRVRCRVDRHLDRIGEVAADDVADVAVERRREEHRLRAPGAKAQDPLDLWREAVVGHPVGLVEDHDVHVGHGNVAGFEQVDQSQRSGHDDLGTLAQALDLLRAARAAVDGEDTLATVFGHRPEDFGDLHGELPGGHEDEAERSTGGCWLDDARQHRHPERQRLPRSRAGPAAHVVAGQGDRDCRSLDLERLGEARRGEAGIDALGHAELGEAGRRLDGRKGGDPRQRSGSLDGWPARLASAPGGASPSEGGSRST